MNNLLKILSREVDNSDRIYLYLEDDNWYAYEQSAYRLKQIVSDCSIQKVISLTYDVVLVRAQISEHRLETELRDFLNTFGEVLVYDTHFEIVLKWQNPIIFEKWKQVALTKHLPCVELEMV